MVSVVVCSLDYRKALESIKELKKDYKCIIVSPQFNYLTKNYFKKNIKNVLFLADEGKGLGNARNIGANKVKTPYLLFMSDDNIITKEQIEKQLKYMINNNYSWCSFLTRIENPKVYWNKCLDMRWEKRFFEGKRDRAGMPCIIQTYLVKEIKFYEGYADDTVFCDKLKELKRRLGYSNIVVYEDNWSYDDLKKRFEMYGKSDLQYFEYNKNKWTFFRKLYIFFRVAIDEWQWNLYFIPFYFWILKQRYKKRSILEVFK